MFCSSFSDTEGPAWGALGLTDVLAIAGRTVGISVGPAVPGGHHGEGVEGAVGGGGPVLV